MKLCPCCKKNPRTSYGSYCKECANKKTRDRYKTDPVYREYRKKCRNKEQRNRRQKERYKDDEEYREKIKKYAREYRWKKYHEDEKFRARHLAYNKTEALSKSMIKCYVKKLSKENLDVIYDVAIKIRDDK